MPVTMIPRQVGNITVFDCAGRITLGEGATHLRDTLREAAAKGNQQILLNLHGVTYVDPSGIGELVSGFTTITNHGGRLKLLAPVRRVEDLLRITKLYTVFEVFTDEPTAIRSFN